MWNEWFGYIPLKVKHFYKMVKWYKLANFAQQQNLGTLFFKWPPSLDKSRYWHQTKSISGAKCQNTFPLISVKNELVAVSESLGPPLSRPILCRKFDDSHWWFDEKKSKHCNGRLLFYCCCCDNTLVLAIFTVQTWLPESQTFSHSFHRDWIQLAGAF